MELDARTLSALGKSLDKHHVPVEDRRILFIIDGTHYRLDASGCWRFENDLDDIGWAECTPPAPLKL